MPVSSAVVTTSKMQLTPMRVTFDGVDLGGTLGNVTVTTEFAKAEIKADQSGDTVRDRRVSAMNISVSTELAQVADKDIWKVVFPHAKEVTSGPNKMMYFQTAIGDSDLANAKILQLHPLALADADLSQDYKFFKACGDAKSEIVYGPNDQVRLKITWNILPDDSVQPEKFFIHGDPTIGLVSASAAAPVFTGTGNGTLTGVTVFNGYTKTETITVKNVGAVVNGGNFSVTGSLSGPLGVAIVGVTFVSNEISFTINDGTTDFVLNDQFTIATTAANYA